MKKVIKITESHLNRIIKTMLTENTNLNDLIFEQYSGKKNNIATKGIPADTTISVNNYMLQVNTKEGKVDAKYKVKHKNIGNMDATKVNFDKENSYLELTISIPYGKGVFVKPKINNKEKKEKMLESGIYVKYNESNSRFTKDSLYLKINLKKNQKALDAIKKATNGSEKINIGEGFTLIKS